MGTLCRINGRLKKYHQINSSVITSTMQCLMGHPPLSTGLSLKIQVLPIQIDLITLTRKNDKEEEGNPLKEVHPSSFLCSLCHFLMISKQIQFFCIYPIRLSKLVQKSALLFANFLTHFLRIFVCGSLILKNCRCAASSGMPISF